MELKDSPQCYSFKKIKYNKGLLDEAVDATYIIHLEGNGRYDDIMNQLKIYHPTKEVYIVFNKGFCVISVFYFIILASSAMIC